MRLCPQEDAIDRSKPMYLEMSGVWSKKSGVARLAPGASAPEILVDRVIAALRGLGPVDVEERHVIEESMEFTLPIELRGAKARPGNEEG